MKKLLCIALLLIGLCLTLTEEVQAESFYEGNFISNTWMIRQKGNRKIWQTARFLHRSSDGMFAYCTEPFSIIESGQYYTEQINPESISAETWERVALIAYYGYGYTNHSDEKWYPITQIMIWKAIDPTSDFYFTDSLNGNRIYIYEAEMQEIEQLVQRHYQKPSFDNTTITMVLGSERSITDQKNVLNTFSINGQTQDVIIDGNELKIKAQQLGKQEILLTKQENNYQVPPIFYYNATNQNLMTAGSIPNLTSKLTINTIETNVHFQKIDKDTKSKENSGQAHLEGAIYQIYNAAMEPLLTITIDEYMEAYIKNLDFGTYYLQELAPGTGYLLDQNIYEFIVSEKETEVELILENEVIKKKIEIYKKYGNPSSSTMLPEAGIIFEFYDEEGNFVTSITTDSTGYGSTILPYGKYKVKQKNTTEGYQKVEDFEIIVDETEEDTFTYHLDNLAIPVPNTREEQKEYTVWLPFVMLGSLGLYVEKTQYHHKYPLTV